MNWSGSSQARRFEFAADCCLLSYSVHQSCSARSTRMLLIGSRSRRLLNHSPHSRGAYSTAYKDLQRPCRWITSVFCSRAIASARVLLQMPAPQPTAASTATSRRVWGSGSQILGRFNQPPQHQRIEFVTMLPDEHLNETLSKIVLTKKATCTTAYNFICNQRQSPPLIREFRACQRDNPTSLIQER